MTDPMPTTSAAKHAPEDRCYFCTTDAELARGFAGQERRTIHMQLPESACPTWTPAPADPMSTSRLMQDAEPDGGTPATVDEALRILRPLGDRTVTAQAWHLVNAALAARAPQPAVPDGEDVPARLDAAADALEREVFTDLGDNLRSVAILLRRASPEVRAAVAVALAAPAPLPPAVQAVVDAARVWASDEAGDANSPLLAAVAALDAQAHPQGQSQ